MRAPVSTAPLSFLGCLAALPLITALVVVPPSTLQARTITTKYQYNADGALTAITKDAGGSSETTTYLTWDDFVPDASDPTTGTVQLGNGTLDEYGPNPGPANATASFTFDARDRLVGYSGGGQTESYQYYAGGTLASSTSGGGEALQFYVDASTNPAVTNIHQLGTGLWSAYLGGARYLSDGAQQVLLSPRKDTACTYTPQNEKLQSYVYDAFGAQSAATLAQQYDLHQNPFQYTGEYRDPLWGGYYLRARWYDPDRPTFISRDPTDQLNRYGYGAGDPANEADPAGTGGGFQRFVASLNRGVGGHFARFFLAPILGPLQIAADPKGFWEAVKHDKAGIDIFLAAGIAAEVFGGAIDASIAFRGLAVSIQRRFLARAVSDAVLGLGQSVAAGADRGFKHFNWESLASGAEMTLGTIGVWRGVLSTNIWSGTRWTGGEAAQFAARQFANEADDTALIFRQRTKLAVNFAKTSPVQEWLGLGNYHERLIAVTKSDFYATDLVSFPEEGVAREVRNYAGYQTGASLERLAGQEGRLEFVGKVRNFNAPGEGRNLFLANPRMLRLRTGDKLIRLGQPNPINKYQVFINNCHDHAFAVLESLGLRRSLRSYLPW
jgi:RHS repeat-associated protein